jgi:phosphoribosylanthranilate isomerase
MKRVRVKICGITRDADLAVAVAAGADAVGFVVGVPSSPRNIPLKQARRLVNQVPLFVHSVVVTIPRRVDNLLKACEALHPDAVQIHGENLPDGSTFREKLSSTTLIRGVNVTPANTLETAFHASRSYDAILLDSVLPEERRYGGTGVVHDWALSQRINAVIHPTPLILAGGLNPENVARAITQVQPYAVDVSSGVESHPGVKDPEKVRAFIENARDAEA